MPIPGWKPGMADSTGTTDFLAESESLLLRRMSYSLRIRSLEMVYRARCGHIASGFSIAEIIAVLYFKAMRLDPLQPAWKERDRFVLSKGHASSIYYAALAKRGFFPEALLETYGALDSRLGGHPVRGILPGVDMTTGSLGNGISAAVGMAQIGKKDGRTHTVFAVAGDGELQEGLAWEAFLYAGNHGLDNLVVIVDRNDLQSGGRVGQVGNLEPLAEKFRSFDFHVQEIDGHDVGQIISAIAAGKRENGRPKVIIARTTKGKGISYMEDRPEWHARVPTEAEYLLGMEELRKEAANHE